jgi:hypothetical protein
MDTLDGGMKLMPDLKHYFINSKPMKVLTRGISMVPEEGVEPSHPWDTRS